MRDLQRQGGGEKGLFIHTCHAMREKRSCNGVLRFQYQRYFISIGLRKARLADIPSRLNSERTNGVLAYGR